MSDATETTGLLTTGDALVDGVLRGSEPRYLDGLEKTMAQTRRATLIAAAVIGAGLIG